MEEMLRKRGKIIIGVVGVVTIPFTIPILTYIVLRDVVQEVKKKTKKVKRDIEIWSLEQTLKLQLELELKKFIYEQSKVQKDIGLKPSDAGFCEWLKDVKKVKIDCVLTNCKQELQAEYEKYLTTGTQELPDWQKDTEFLLKLQEISQDFTYKSHPTAITTSKLINTKEINRQLNSLDLLGINVSKLDFEENKKITSCEAEITENNTANIISSLVYKLESEEISPIEDKTLTQISPMN
ncbi:11996_t:CDS:2 [Rhizophagus irregularis]|nr:11996_t:CDS:2 [Rhizophagus irregularis]